MKKLTIHRYIWMIIFAVALYAIFIIYSSFDQTVQIISSFPFVLFIIML